MYVRSYIHRDIHACTHMAERGEKCAQSDSRNSLTSVCFHYAIISVAFHSRNFLAPSSPSFSHFQRIFIPNVSGIKRDKGKARQTEVECMF